MDIKILTEKMESASHLTIFVTSHIGNMDAMESEQNKVETNIRNLGAELHQFSRTELYNEYKSLEPNMPMSSPMSELTVDVLVERIINIFINRIVISVKVSEPTGILMFIEEQEFYNKIQSLINNKDKMEIEENLRSNGIDFLRNNSLFIGPMG